jgi:hypothetical protein
MGKSTSTSSMAFLLKSFRLSKHLVQIRDAQNHVGERERERGREREELTGGCTHGWSTLLPTRNPLLDATTMNAATLAAADASGWR